MNLKLHNCFYITETIHLLLASYLSLILSHGTFSNSARAEAPTIKPKIGVIRWDAWFPGSPFASSLLERIRPELLPFYASVKGTKSYTLNALDDEVAKREVAYARSAGVDYFIFDLFLDGNVDGSPSPIMENFIGALQRFTKVKDKSGMKFGVYLTQPQYYESSDRLRDLLLQAVRSSDYQRDQDGRAIIFVPVHGAPSWFDNKDRRDELTRIVARISADIGAAVGTRPFLVGMTFDPRQGRDLIEMFGFDAISSYGNPLGKRSPTEPTGRRDFSRCYQASAYFWAVARRTGVRFLPPVSLGWDYRPLIGDPKRDPDPEWCDQPNAEQVRSAIVAAQEAAANAGAQSIVVYAWNEFTEGGYLIPTLCDKASKLQGLADATSSTEKLSRALALYPLPDSPLACHGAK